MHINTLVHTQRHRSTWTHKLTERWHRHSVPFNIMYWCFYFWRCHWCVCACINVITVIYHSVRKPNSSEVSRQSTKNILVLSSPWFQLSYIIANRRQTSRQTCVTHCEFKALSCIPPILWHIKALGVYYATIFSFHSFSDIGACIWAEHTWCRFDTKF